VQSDEGAPNSSADYAGEKAEKFGEVINDELRQDYPHVRNRHHNDRGTENAQALVATDGHEAPPGMGEKKQTETESWSLTR
jgi:hypothetical protein